MAKFYTGIEGKLSVDGVAISRVASWSLNREVEAIDRTRLDDSARRYCNGRQMSAGTCSFYYYESDDDTLEAKPLLGALIRTGTVPRDQTYRLKLASANRSVEFDAVITSVETSAAPGSVMQANVAFSVTGPLLEASLGGN